MTCPVIILMEDVMGLTINSGLNTSVISSLSNTYNKLNDNVMRLATGLRLENDDPAGYAVSTKYRAQISSIAQGELNLDEGVSVVQTAEDAISEIDENLTRMKELATQASTSTYTAAQRLTMQSEFETMAAEIDRIAGSTEYNESKLLDGSIAISSYYQTTGGWNEPNNGKLIHFGDKADRAEDYYYIALPNMSTNSLFNSSTIAVSTSTAAQAALIVLNTALQLKENAEGWVGALQNRLQSTLNVLDSKQATLDNAIHNIRDIDYATEMTNFVRNQVIAQSSIAMLAQANVLNQYALKLL